jgi:hypothetical protein
MWRLFGGSDYQHNHARSHGTSDGEAAGASSADGVAHYTPHRYDLAPDTGADENDVDDGQEESPADPSLRTVELPRPPQSHGLHAFVHKSEVEDLLGAILPRPGEGEGGSKSASGGPATDDEPPIGRRANELPPLGRRTDAVMELHVKDATMR